MRKIVLILTAILAATGLLLTFYAAAGLDLGWRKAVSLAHIWGGVLFLVMFTLYAWDHIIANRRWLRIPALVTVTGAVQTLSAVVIMVTGIVLLLYGNVAWQVLRDFHHWLTYAIVASIALHFLSRKY
jgi:hypothetical protein